MNQPYPFYNSRPRRRQSEHYQQAPTFNPYNQQLSNFQSGQNTNATMHQQPYYQAYHQQYHQPFQQPFQPFVGSGGNGNVHGQFMNTPYHTPYPKPAPNLKQQSSGFQTVISQFKKSDGQLDYSKMMDTAGQMVSAVNQMGGLFKGVTSMFK
jgi:hypothetical protein